MRISSLILVITVLTLTNCNTESNVKVQKPNIIYILADDLGYNELGCYGQQIIETPNIDRLAKEGMVFTEHYAGSNICAPSRCALMTGKHSGHGWIRDNKPLPFEGFYGYNCQRHAHSYYTHYMRQNDDSVTLKGNLKAPYTDYTADVIHSKALQFIEDNKDKPFFLYYPSTLPHSPYHQPDDEILDYYAKKTGMPKGNAIDMAFSVPKHAAMTARLDKHVGEVMAKLKELNILNNTLVIFTSDNGTALRPQQNQYLKTGGELHGRKGEVYEGGIKAPMIAFWKDKILPGTTSDHISAFWDVLPTFAELVNVENPANIDGISFLPTLLGKQDEQQEHDYLYWERNQTQAIRKGDMKAVISYDKVSHQQSVEIYNLSQDPFEKNNLADTQTEVTEEFIELAKTARINSELFPLIKKNNNQNKLKHKK